MDRGEPVTLTPFCISSCPPRPFWIVEPLVVPAGVAVVWGLMLWPVRVGAGRRVRPVLDDDADRFGLPHPDVLDSRKRQQVSQGIESLLSKRTVN